MPPIIVATGNLGKLREIGQILSGLPVVLTSLRDHWSPVPDIPEDGETFQENAYAKADWVFSRKHVWTLADDSGLEVDALSGAPGVRSARYAGEGCSDADNVAKLLGILREMPLERRTARFRCVMVLRTGSDSSIVAEGTCEGTIGFEARGTDGFGYDPLFVPDGFDKTFAQLDSSAKNAISHRGKALAQLKARLLSVLP
jgi:XTP/dITP diphosphohydrolase